MRKFKIGAAIAATLILVSGVYTAFHFEVLTPKDLQLNSNDPEKPFLHFFISGPSTSRLPDPEEDFVKKKIETLFNVNLRMTVMAPDDDYIFTIASKLAANDPPDMWLNISPDGGAKYTLDNMLADMNYYVTPATMPNYFKWWMNETELREYQVHNKFARAPIPFDRKSYRAYYIRKDWLDHLGLDIPTTYDQYLNALRKFTYDDPDGNGTDDTYGFTTYGNGKSISQDWPEFVKNGLTYPNSYVNGKLVDMQTDLRVGQVVDDILTVIKEGLVDPDWFLNTNRQHFNKAVQGKAGVILGDTADFALESNPNSLQARSRAINPQAEWVPFNPLADKPLRVETSAEYPFVFSNNTAGLNPDLLKKTASILDWLAGEEGFLLTHYGVEGKHYTRAGNTITLHPETIEADIEKKGDFLKIWDFFTPNTPEVLDLTVIDPRVTERDKMVLQLIQEIPVYEGLGTTLTPPIGINVEEMRAKQNEMQVNMLFSDKSGALWPQYRQELMTKYNGEFILNQYENKIRSARRNN